MAKKLWLILILWTLAFGLKGQVRLDDESVEAMLRSYNFWKLTKPRMNVLMGVLDTPTSIFQLHLPDTVIKKESRGILTIGSTWHKNTVTRLRINERIDSILRITDDELVDSASMGVFYRYYDKGYDLYCAYGHFLAFEDSMQSFSGRYFGISQHYFMARLGVQKSSGKVVSEIISIDSVNLLEPKQIYAGYFSFYPKKYDPSASAKRYPFFLTEKLPVSADKETRVLPDLRPVGIWKFRENALIKCPKDMLIPPFMWWENSLGKLPPPPLKKD